MLDHTSLNEIFYSTPPNNQISSCDLFYETQTVSQVCVRCCMVLSLYDAFYIPSWNDR